MMLSRSKILFGILRVRLWQCIVLGVCIATYSACSSTKVTSGADDDIEKGSTTSGYKGPSGTVSDSNATIGANTGEETSRNTIYLGSEAMSVGQGTVLDIDPNTGGTVVINIAETKSARRLRRMSAEQFHNSLVVATGQRWEHYENFAGVLGRPNYIESMEENLDVSVGFIKLAGDAARDACQKAINKDDKTTPADRVIMRNLIINNPMQNPSIETLKYLFRRFHSTIIIDDNDPRLRPFIRVLDDTIDDDPSNDDDAVPNYQGSREEIKARWLTVCVGLVMHPDFYSY